MTDRFLDVVAADPESGKRLAEDALRCSDDPIDLTFAHRALAVCHRDSGDIEGTWAHLEAALALARRIPDGSVFADVMATRGGTNIILGNPRRGLRDLSRAAEAAQGFLLATVLYRRGVSYSILGNPKFAARDAEAAIEILEPFDDSVWLPDALALLGEQLCRLGNLQDAGRRFAECHAIIGDDSGYRSIRLKMMRAWLSFLEGDLPAALAQFSGADLTSIEDGRLRGEVTWRLATTYLAAGLIPEAIEVLRLLEGTGVPPTVEATCRGMRAQALLLANQGDQALSVATAASADLARMGLEIESAESTLAAFQAETLVGAADDLATRATSLAEALSTYGSRLAADGWLLVGEAALKAEMDQTALVAFRRGAEYRHNPNLLVASSGWLARARELETSRSAGVLRACACGLDALDRYREVMGSSEIRARASHRGDELSRVAVRTATRDPRTLLTWSERWRATALAQRPVTNQGSVAPEVAMLRDIGRLIAETRSAGESTEALEKERRVLERKVRSEHHQQRAEPVAARGRFDPAELVAEVGEHAFVQVVNVEGHLHVLFVSNGVVRRAVAGDAAVAHDMAEAGRFALRRAARTGRFAPGDLGQRFQDAVFGDAARLFPDGPIVVSPTALLHGAPFALMPALVERSFSVVPSAAQWLRARKVTPAPTGRRALVSGPGLLTGGSEVARLASRYPEATILRGSAATVEATMKAIDGAHLAHLATHGTFRADSPLFSALELADGPLSVYELERLKRAPYRTILSACDSGVLAPVGAQEVLGLASALFSLGSAGLVCSIAEVNDEATADLMMDVHAEIDAGRTPAEALAKVRAEADPITLATASAFVALGV